MELLKNNHMDKQIKNSFDAKTVIKIAKGAVIAATGAGALAFLDYIGKIHVNDPALASFVAWFVPVATVAVKEFLKGEEK